MALKPLTLVAFAAVSVGNLLHIIGLSTPEWCIIKPYIIAGLWKWCDYHSRDCDTYKSDEKEDFIKESEGLAIAGMIVGLVVLAATAYICVMDLKERSTPRYLAIVALAGSIVGCILILSCAGHFRLELKKSADPRDKMDVDVGYSFILSILGGAFVLIGGGLVFRVNQVQSAYERM